MYGSLGAEDTGLRAGAQAVWGAGCGAGVHKEVKCPWARRLAAATGEYALACRLYGSSACTHQTADSGE